MKAKFNTSNIAISSEMFAWRKTRKNGSWNEYLRQGFSIGKEDLLLGNKILHFRKNLPMNIERIPLSNVWVINFLI